MKYNNLEATLHTRLEEAMTMIKNALVDENNNRLINEAGQYVLQSPLTPIDLIKWPNIQYTEEQETTQWVWPRMIDGQARSANLGDAGLNFINSIYQVSIYTQRNTGTETANYYVEGLLQAFPKGERLSFDGGVIILGVAYRSTAFNEDAFLHTPVTIPFTAHMEI